LKKQNSKISRQISNVSKLSSNLSNFNYYEDSGEWDPNDDL
jgi:hypothetical protein